MIISRLLLKTRYKVSQFVGALVVVAGLAVVLMPQFLNSSEGRLSWHFGCFVSRALMVCCFFCCFSL